jgi:hypothetical protein
MSIFHTSCHWIAAAPLTLSFLVFDSYKRRHSKIGTATEILLQHSPNRYSSAVISRLLPIRAALGSGSFDSTGNVQRKDFGTGAELGL